MEFINSYISFINNTDHLTKIPGLENLTRFIEALDPSSLIDCRVWSYRTPIGRTVFHNYKGRDKNQKDISLSMTLKRRLSFYWERLEIADRTHNKSLLGLPNRIMANEVIKYIEKEGDEREEEDLLGVIKREEVYNY